MSTAVRFYGSTASAAGTAEPDPAAWLGGNRSSTRLEEVQSTITATPGAREQHAITDSARIGDGANAHALKWVLMLTGAAAMSAARVERFDDVTGRFHLDRRLAALPTSGDAYALFDGANCLPDVTAEESGDGETRYRCITCRNETGGALTNVKYHFTELGSADLTELRLAPQVTAAVPTGILADEFTSPQNALGQFDFPGLGNMSGSSGLEQPGAASQQSDVTASLASNGVQAVYLERVIGQDAPRRNALGILVVVTSDTVTAGCVIAWDVAGFTADASLQIDRYQHPGGGGRCIGEVRSLETGDVVEGVPVTFAVRFGDPGSVITENDPAAGWDETDRKGVAACAYTGPTDRSYIGREARVRMLVPNGTEVGDPQKRVSVALAIDAEAELAAILSITSGEALSPEHLHAWFGVSGI